MEKLSQVVHTDRPLNKVAIFTIWCKWREFFSLGFYEKKGTWPKMAFDEQSPQSYLLDTLKNGKHLDRSHPNYDIRHWEYITFLQNFNISGKFEQTEMISEKAGSLNLPELKIRCEEYGDIGPAYSRSVIIQWLRTNFQNPLEFLTAISENGFPPPRHKVLWGSSQRKGDEECPATLRSYATIWEIIYCNNRGLNR